VGTLRTLSPLWLQDVDLGQGLISIRLISRTIVSIRANFHYYLAERPTVEMIQSLGKISEIVGGVDNRFDPVLFEEVEKITHVLPRSHANALKFHFPNIKDGRDIVAIVDSIKPIAATWPPNADAARERCT
jgi:hypothetical protein